MVRTVTTPARLATTATATRSGPTSTAAATALCHGEASCGGYDNDPRDGQCGHASEVKCANVPWASSTASQTETESPNAPAVLGVYVENFSTSIEYRTYYAFAVGGGKSACVLPSKGVLIDELQPGGPAASAGLRGGKLFGGGYVDGDVIESLNGNPIPDTDVLTSELARQKPGDVVDVGIVRCDGSQPTIPITLGSGAPAPSVNPHPISPPQGGTGG